MQSTKSRKSQVQKKLVAAVAMLLVSCVMVVNSTYAWFTLSTAPEVTGIATSVGANGNLEMALLDNTTGTNLAQIQSAVGDSSSVQDVTEANVTWGNLVDLSSDAYHLKDITLLPSRLNQAADKVVSNIPLATPQYGADGRVSKLETTSTFGIWNETSKGFASDKSTYGVRAIGTANAMTPGEKAINTALAAISTNMTSASSKASTALNDNGQDLANIALDYAMGKKTEGYTAANMATIQATVTALNEAVGKVGDALKNAVVVLYEANNSSAVHIDAGSVIIDLTGTDPVVKVGTETVDTTSHTAFTTALTKYAAMVTNVSSAQSAIDSAGSTAPYTWSKISAPLRYVMDTDQIKVNGDSVSGELNVSDLAGKIIAAGRVLLTFGSGSGIFADIAEFTGNYDANIKVTVNYNGAEIKDFPANMATNVEVGPYLTQIYDAIKNTQAGDKQSAQANAVITDYYGYAVDLAFRTNAAGSKLQLQIADAQRIYEDSTNTDTQGGGSYMEFKSETGLTNAQIASLMDAIRIVFMNRTDGTIYAIATLNTTADALENTANGLKARLQLVEYSFAEDGKLNIGAVKTDNSLLELQQNTAVAMTAMVYLDGDKVQNKDVANGATSMAGTLNLQFASDATLTPMKNTALMGDTSGSGSTDATEATEATEETTVAAG